MSRNIPMTSDEMEKFYSENPDPWGNHEIQLYERLLPPIIDSLKEVLSPYLEGKVRWFDVGVGGGNVVYGLDKGLKQVFGDLDVQFSGCDISETAISRLRDTKFFENLYCTNLDEMTAEDDLYKDLSSYSIISMIEVIYYLGKSVGYKRVLDTIWSSLKPGTLVIVADGLVRNQYRDYLGSKEDSELLKVHNDHTTPICKEISDSGRSWTRYMKVRVYRKL